jgi:hypothetical protein
MSTTSGVLEAALSEYFDVYSANPENPPDFTWNHFFLARLQSAGILRVVMLLPGGTTKTLDVDNRMARARVEKVLSVSTTTSNLMLRIGDSALEISSVIYSGSLRPFTYQVWTFEDKRPKAERTSTSK